MIHIPKQKELEDGLDKVAEEAEENAGANDDQGEPEDEDEYVGANDPEVMCSSSIQHIKSRGNLRFTQLLIWIRGFRSNN